MASFDPRELERQAAALRMQTAKRRRPTPKKRLVDSAKRRVRELRERGVPFTYTEVKNHVEAE